MVMCSCRAFPLVGIVEFIMYGCMKYFRERYTAASINISNPQIQFCKRVTQYMQEKIEKAKLHRVISTGTMEHRFEVICKDRSGRGIRRDRVVQESLITVDGKAFCSCMKPKLLHLPCSHLIAACAESGLQPGVFVSPYFSKEAAYLTWYLPRTRARLVYVDTHPQPHQARPQDGYARHHVEALAGAVSLLIIFAYIYNHIHKIIHVFLTVPLLNGCSFAFAT